MKRVNHRPLSRRQIRSEEEEKMVRFSLGREEDDNNEEGPSSRPVPKKRRTYGGTFSCNADYRQQQQPQQEPERRCEIEETVVEEEEEEEEDIFEEEDFVTDEEQVEEEEEDWNPESEPESGRNPDPGLNRSNNTVAVLNPDSDLEGSRGNGSISVTLSDPDVLDCPICLEPLSTPVFQCSVIKGEKHKKALRSRGL